VLAHEALGLELLVLGLVLDAGIGFSRAMRLFVALNTPPSRIGTYSNSSAGASRSPG
jgi:hypothetical protein